MKSPAGSGLQPEPTSLFGILALYANDDVINNIKRGVHVTNVNPQWLKGGACPIKRGMVKMGSLRPFDKRRTGLTHPYKLCWLCVFA